MLAIRQLSSRIFQRSCLSTSVRYQSSTTTTDLTSTSSSDLEQKPAQDYTLWATSETNRLIDYLSMRIKAAGPITVADFMHEALLNPKYVRHFSLCSYSTYTKTDT